MGKKIGIDLGTTNSCVSLIDDTGVIRIIDPLEGGGYTTPSVVFFDISDNSVMVGETAIQEGFFHPECVVECVRNYVGVPDFNYYIGEQEYSPTAITSLILKKLITDAEAWLGSEEIEGAVITCPAYFGIAAREAIKFAAECVFMSNGKKLNVLQILDEPIAAALAYGNSLHEDFQKNVLIYDLGGATFDVTLVKVHYSGNSRNIEIISADGDHQLGGKDWDEVLKNCVMQKFCETTGADIDEIKCDLEQMFWYRENIERSKKVLTKKETVRLVPQFNGCKERIEISREIFDAETEHLLERTVQIIDDMLNRKGLSMLHDVDEIVLVGGAARMPQVERRLSKEYNKPITAYEPETLIAQGAALFANGVGCFINDPKLSTLTNESIGIKVDCNGEQQIYNFILKDTQITGCSNISDHFYLSVGSGNEQIKQIGVTLVKNQSKYHFCKVDERCTEWAFVKFSLNRCIREDTIIDLRYTTAHTTCAGFVELLQLLDDEGNLLSEKEIVWKKRAFLGRL